MNALDDSFVAFVKNGMVLCLLSDSKNGKKL